LTLPLEAGYSGNPMALPLEKFPRLVSLTLSNKCNLRCQMCGQWGKSGYLKGNFTNKTLPLETWKKIVQEISDHKPSIILIRGGEPFLHPDIIPLLSFIKEKGVFVAIDSNGTFLEKYAEQVVDLGIDDINLSVDGPEEIHDEVRGVKGTYQQVKKGVLKIQRLAAEQNEESCVKVIAFTISPYSYRGLSAMPDVAREMGIPNIAIVPYYYFDNQTGLEYEEVMKRELDCVPFSWRGFYNESSGIDPAEFILQLRKFKENLGAIKLVPFMDFSEDDYVTWFTDRKAVVGKPSCANAWNLIDIQPDGEVNFCVDYPDYSIGNIQSNSIEELWHNSRSNKFREYIKDHAFPICNRCGAKYM
jgi:MoaA/NifB/PqqE/SkfB family radical SAM enzyme